MMQGVVQTMEPPSAGRRRLFTYVVKRDGDFWRIFLDGHGAGRFRAEGEAVAEAEKLAREACGVGGSSRLVIARDHATEVRLLRSDLFRGLRTTIDGSPRPTRGGSN